MHQPVPHSEKTLPAHRRFDVADHLNHDAVVKAFLLQATATGNPDILHRAKSAVERAAARKAAASPTVGPRIGEG